VPKAGASRGVWGHAPPENFENLEPQRCYFMHFGEGFSQKSYLLSKIKEAKPFKI